MQKNEFLPYRMVDAVIRSLLHIVPYTELTERVALEWGYRFRPAPAIARLRSGGQMAVDLNDHLQLLLYYFGTFEPEALLVMKSRLREGATIIDVGANIAFYTVEAARVVGATGKVIAIEASPILIEKINDHLAMNRLSNVVVFHCAAGQRDGVVTLTLPNDGHHGMFTLGAVDGSEKYDVPMRRIDDVVLEQDLKAVDFIKMDIEGSELGALQGASRTLERFKPPILLELNSTALSRCGTSPETIKLFLSEFGYKGYLIKKNMAPIAQHQSHDCDECLFLAG